MQMIKSEYIKMKNKHEELQKKHKKKDQKRYENQNRSKCT